MASLDILKETAEIVSDLASETFEFTESMADYLSELVDVDEWSLLLDEAKNAIAETVYERLDEMDIKLPTNRELAIKESYPENVSSDIIGIGIKTGLMGVAAMAGIDPLIAGKAYDLGKEFIDTL